jgi:hypothetical protein
MIQCQTWTIPHGPALTHQNRTVDGQANETTHGVMWLAFQHSFKSCHEGWSADTLCLEYIVPLYIGGLELSPLPHSNEDIFVILHIIAALNPLHCTFRKRGRQITRARAN